jgi:high affinity Mn2+ porin
VTIFPHSETAPWWVSGQVNIIFQAHPNFHALYSGPHSFGPESEHATSRILTLYTGYQFNHSTEMLFDLESAGGAGLSTALGLAGFTNLDVVRSPDLGNTPYIARLMLHKVFALSSEEQDEERSPASLIVKLPVRRLEIRGGKFSLADYFDVNSVGSDSHLQFMNWTADNNGSYDYAADTRGYTVGVMLEYQDRNWGVRFAETLMPKVANGPTLDRDIRQSRAENTELEFRPQFVPKRKTIFRLLSFVNHASMGSYREAIQAFVSGANPQPDITAHRKPARIKYGFGFNGEHELSGTVRVFARVGWNEGKNESFAFTEVDQSLAFGGDWRMEVWRRPVDKLGLTFMSNAISKLHQEYLALGGQGFLLGDGKLTYGREDILEGYYTAHLWRGIFISPNIQFLEHPGYNRDRGPVVVGGLRLHVDL